MASLELMWTAHQGDHLLISGFVHPPTESRAWEALRLANETNLITVKAWKVEQTCRSGVPASPPGSSMVMQSD